jgi:transposase
VNRFNRWRKAAVWDRLLEAVSKAYDGAIQMIDASSIRVHRHAANAKKRRSGCMGRSRGGLTTKIHALVDAAGLPLALKLTEGQAHDGRSARDMLGALTEGQTLLAGRADDSDELRKSLDERGAWANIKPMSNRKNVPAFSSYLYRYRNLVERFFNKIKHYRAVATRYDKTPDNFLAGVKLASLRIWMRFYESSNADQVLARLYPAPKGEKVWPPLAMFKALLLATWHDLSDVALAGALSDRASFRRFCGFSCAEATPERTAFLRFRRELLTHGLDRNLFEAISRDL